MGKTVPSYRLALEYEIQTWKPFRKSLTQRYQQVFDRLMDMSRSHASAAGAACQPVMFWPMIVSILLAQQKKIMQLEKDLYDAQETRAENVAAPIVQE